MKYWKLGRTGIDVGIVGLGAEYLEHAPRDTIDSVVSEAIDKQRDNNGHLTPVIKNHIT